MATYRLFRTNGLRKIEGVQELEANDDAEAVSRACGLQLHVSCELWQADRLVAQIAPHDPPESARPRRSA